MTTPPNRPGRPRLDPDGRRIAPVTVTFTAAEYDGTAKLAAARRETVQEVIRRAVQRELKQSSG